MNGVGEDEWKAVKDVLRAMLLDGEEWVKQRRFPPNMGRARPFRALRREQLDAYLLNGECGRFKAGEGIRTRPPRHEAHMSALWCKWRFHSGRMDCWFFLGTWLGDGKFIVFRFEPP